MSDTRWKLKVDQQGVTIAGDHFQLTTTVWPDGVPAGGTADDVLLGMAESGRVESTLSELAAMTRRSYGQYCGLARAEEILGERWVLLILRDLTVGPRTAAELERGLPLISPEVLAARLRDLERTHVVTSNPLPDGTPRYRLTDYGVELEAILLRLGTWGARLLGTQRPEEIVTTASQVVALRSTFRPEQARDLRATYEIRIGDDIRLHARVDDGAVRVAAGTAARPDLVIEPGTWLKALMAGEIDPLAAVADGRIRITGEPALLVRFAAMFRVPEPVTGAG
ncbi:MAG TPA: winged helix-turn-helix transcriptional regulator [Actinophytocola sp.]|uniref:winged helix-turn-helix transcriptional regulator n=1 Tax=Actinophytocola sp. TaxID=1872138 RepID=UPI002DBFB5A6|nr:winged helix-turn-helix transcriptional regulator [Actinophytocola sp.]HEU5474180.1 winged helix-turn-helix transcriptional regulator [Actinophytocola sp.]